MKQLCKKLKKGFTLVELAIVIAVIAILVAVLVPTFVALIDKAGESKDSQLVKNINTAITIENASDEITTMQEAIDAAKANGYNVSQITPTSDGYDILWDQETKYFLLADSEGNIVYSTTAYSSDKVSSYTTSRFWKIIDSKESLSSTYSNYLAYDVTEITAVTGIDVGENTNVAVTIEEATAGAQSVKTKVGTATAEKTAGGTETESTIMVNCDAGSLIIETTATVTINGNISSNVQITKEGANVVVAKKANVPNFLVSASGVTITNNSSVKITAATTNTAYVITVNGSSNEVVKGVDTQTLAKFAGGYGTEGSPYLISTETELRNIGDFSAEMEKGDMYYFQLINDVTLYRTADNDVIANYFNGVFDGNNYSITVAVAEGKVVGGRDESGYGTYWFFVNPIDATVKDLTVYHTSGENISIAYGWATDSNSTSIKTSKLTFDNVDMGDESTRETLTMERNASGYINYFCGQELTFKNCDNYYNLVSNNPSCYSGVYIGGYYSCSVSSNDESNTRVVRGYYKQTITFDGCVNYGTIKGANASVFVGNGSYTKLNASASDVNYQETASDGTPLFQNASDALNVIMTNCQNKASASYYLSGGLYSNQTSDAEDKIVKAGCSGFDAENINDKNLALTYTGVESEAYNVTKADTADVKYQLLLMGSASYSSSTSNAAGSHYVTLSFDLSLDFTNSNTVATDYKYQIMFYDLDSYKEKYTSLDENWDSDVEWKDVSQISGCKYYYDETNNCYVFDFSGVNSELGYTYTMSSAPTIAIAVYSDSGNLVGLQKAVKVS